VQWTRGTRGCWNSSALPTDAAAEHDHYLYGTSVEMTLPTEGAPSTESGNALEGLTPFVGKITTLPPNFAERHDEYIHGC
jgi:hypothetical protein